jgi:fermentation-respiration switch protein FrsA (DUF1100 family)
VRLLSRIRYDNLAKAPGLGVPVLLAHSPDDEVIPFEFGRRLFEAAREPKTFIELSGGHNDGGFALRPQWREEARAFLLRALSAG